MVTMPLAQRFDYLRRSVESYVSQTYPMRELVIVFEAMETPGAHAVQRYISSLGRSDIRLAPAFDAPTLGALRNHSRAQARGDFHIQWDDDDFHHPLRIERQLAFLLDVGAEAVCLQQVMQLFAASRRLYCLNWAGAEAGGFPGSLLCRGSAPVRYPDSGPNARRGEDTDLIAQLQRGEGYRVLADAPHLYVYVSHGLNTWSDDHHQMLAGRLAISRGLLLRRETMLREGLAAFDFGPGPVTLEGANGPAFVIGG
jgi:glycosyltransferase involved in cell wall biosynthesis